MFLEDKQSVKVSTLPEGTVVPFTWENYYEISWNAHFQLVKLWAEGGERNVSRLLDGLDLLRLTKTLAARRFDDGTIGGEICWFRRDDFPSVRFTDSATGVLHGDYVMMPAMMRLRIPSIVADAAQDAVQNGGQEIDCIAEVGCGFGRMIHRVWLSGGPATADYLGLECSASGRALAEYLAGLAPGYRFKTAPFTLNAPDFSALAPYRRVLLFSAWTLMYGATLDMAFFEALAELPGEVTMFFWEPFGFQMVPGGSMSRLQLVNMTYKAEHNMTFLDVAKKASEAGLIEIWSLLPHYFSQDENSLQLASVMVFHKPAKDGA